MNPEILERSYASFGSVLANVKEEQLDDPTPCASWKVRDIINHVVGGTTWFAIAAETGEAPNLDPARAPDFSRGDFRNDFAEGSQRALTAFRADGVLQKQLRLPFAELPGAAIAGIAASDAFVHGWDLAHATGQSVDLDPELAAILLDNAKRMVRPEFRGEEGKAAFGPELEAPESAPAATRLAAFMGRRT